jgi:ABC-type phosphate transport system substrate-binding protein
MNLHLARRGAKASVLATAAIAVTALGTGAGAGSAQAATCTGSNIHGEGAWLQAKAQSIWTADFPCTTPRVTYTPTSSGLCQAGRWGADGGAFTASVQFCGTDQPPTTTQITNLNANLRASVLSIPVAQAAIAIIVNPPSGCSISSITSANLEAVFRGSTTSWSSIGSGAGCAGQSVTRVVRNDSAGTTYQLKHFLNTVHSTKDICSGSTTIGWSDLQASNQVWPTVCNTYPSMGVTYSQMGCPSCTPGGTGEDDEAKTVKATPNSIGYASLYAARGQYTGTDRYKWLRLDTGFGPVDPSTTAPRIAGRSNCTTTAGAYGTTLPSATSSWADVYLVRPATGYGICTLTWALASNNYAARTDWTVSGLRVTGANAGTTAKDYLGYVVATTGGQNDALASANDYQILPNAGGGTGDVQAAALTGAALIR